MFTEYKVVSAEKSKELCERVEASLDEGWKLHGHLIVQSGEDWLYFYQAMTRDNENEPE